MNQRTGYWIYYVSDDQYNPSFGLEIRSEKSEVEEFINRHPNWAYEVIWGTERTVKPVTTVTVLEIDQ